MLLVNCYIRNKLCLNQPTSEDMKLYITTGLTEGWPRPNQPPCGPASKRRGWPGAERARQPRSGPAALDPPPGPCATRSQSAHSAQLPCVHPALAGAIRSGADQKANRRGQSWDGCVDGARAERAHHWPLITVVSIGPGPRWPVPYVRRTARCTPPGRSRGKLQPLVCHVTSFLPRASEEGCRKARLQGSGAEWKFRRWPSWTFRPNAEPYGFRGRKAILNHAHALVSACP